MQGKRIPDISLAEEHFPLLNPGEYQKLLNKDGTPTGIWHLCTPDGHHGSVRDTIWSITEHEDGSITVSPSIRISTTNRQNVEHDLWHGYLEGGVWRSV
jgi:hypothetical protein